MRAFTTSGVAAFLAVSAPAFADCKASPDAYELVDLGTVLEGDADAQAVAIDARGRIVISAQADGLNSFPVEYVRERSGKIKPVKQTDDGSVRTTKAYLNNQVRFTDYIKRKSGYVPLELETLVDRRGEEMAVGDYCRGPSENDHLQTFVISPSGEAAAAKFKTDAGMVMARCVEGEPAEILFEDMSDARLVAINDAGMLAGDIPGAPQAVLWRWADGKRTQAQVPEDLMDVVIDGIDEDGNIYATTVGLIKNTSLRYDVDGDMSALDILPGAGWDLDWQAVGPCGHIIGMAFHTNLESFLALPAAEQQALKADMPRYMDFAAQREEAMFVWSPDKGGRFLSSMLPELGDWDGLSILDINEKGQAVGVASTNGSRMRAILLDPQK